MAARHAGDAMDLDETSGGLMTVAGVGCRRGVTAAEIDAAIDAALRQAGCTADALCSIATSDGKGGEQGLIEAAQGRGLQLVLVKPAALEAAGPRTQSFSPRVQDLFGVPSVAEAAALAAAGPEARLVFPRIVLGPVTCALAGTDGAA